MLTGHLFINNGFGHDGDPDGTPIEVTAIDGDPNAVGQTITLASGAKLTVNSDGTFTYDPRGAFDLPHSASGAVNGFAADGFSYTITGDDVPMSRSRSAASPIRATPISATSSTTKSSAPPCAISSASSRAATTAPTASAATTASISAAHSTGTTSRTAATASTPDPSGRLQRRNHVRQVRPEQHPRHRIDLARPGANSTYVESSGALYSYSLTFIDANVAAGATMRGQRLSPHARGKPDRRRLGGDRRRLPDIRRPLRRHPRRRRAAGCFLLRP